MRKKKRSNLITLSFLLGGVPCSNFVSAKTFSVQETVSRVNTYMTSVK